MTGGAMMAGMRSRLRHVTDGEATYDALVFWCPGCERVEDGERQGGLHMLPVTGDGATRPVWGWDGSLEAPTLSPSILTRHEHWRGEGKPPKLFVCHSYLRGGVFEFLGDCTHALAGQHVPMPELPEWAL